MEVIQIRKESIADQVYHYIKQMILSGEFKQGEKISEERVSNDLGVSRTPVREAFKRLEAYGLIKIKPRSHVEVMQLDEKEVRNIAEIRAVIEEYVVRSIAGKVGDIQYQMLEGLAKECEEASVIGNRAITFEKDSKFHLEMARCTENNYIYEIMERLDAKVQLYRMSKCVTLEKVQRDVKQHYKILRAIKKGDAQMAAQLMKKHVLGFTEEGDNQ